MSVPGGRVPRPPSPARRRMLRRRRRTVGFAAMVAVTALGLVVAGDLGSGQAGGSEPAAVTATAGSTLTTTERADQTTGGAGETAAVPPGETTAVPPGCPAAADACVDLTGRVSWLQDDGRVSYGPVPALPGVGQFATPAGDFRVEWKADFIVSDEYGDPMPHSVFFAPGGIAFHAGSLTTPSHGCVHLRPDDASAYFDRLPVGARVVVFAAA